MPQFGFFYDMTACSSCKTCQIACKDKNNSGTE
jgi:anaerobic dimethyl sulfoxide reductase subunit B (iron-sulfur subunit)